jgi:hypothetical protein
LRFASFDALRLFLSLCDLRIPVVSDGVAVRVAPSRNTARLSADDLRAFLMRPHVCEDGSCTARDDD